MTVKELKERLERVNPELEVFVWNEEEKIYTEATYINVEELFKLDGDERVYDDDGDPIMFDAFVITY